MLRCATFARNSARKSDISQSDTLKVVQNPDTLAPTRDTSVPSPGHYGARHSQRVSGAAASTCTMYTVLWREHDNCAMLVDAAITLHSRYIQRVYLTSPPSASRRGDFNLGLGSSCARRKLSVDTFVVQMNRSRFICHQLYSVRGQRCCCHSTSTPTSTAALSTAHTLHYRI